MIIGISGKLNSGKDTVGRIIQYLTAANTEAGKAIGMHCSIEEYVKSADKSCNDVFQVKQFATKIKQIVCILIGCNLEELEDREFKEKELGEEWWIIPAYTNKYPYSRANEFSESFVKSIVEKLTPRKLMQLIGTECGRQIIHPNLWINALMSEYKSDMEIEYGSSHTYYPDDVKKFPNWIITDVRFPNEAKAIKDRDGILIRVNRPCTTCNTYDSNLCSNSYHLNNHPSETALDEYTGFKYEIENIGTIDELIEIVKSILKQESII